MTSISSSVRKSKVRAEAATAAKNAEVAFAQEKRQAQQRVKKLQEAVVAAEQRRCLAERAHADAVPPVEVAFVGPAPATYALSIALMAGVTLASSIRQFWCHASHRIAAPFVRCPRRGHLQWQKLCVRRLLCRNIV